MFLLSIPTPCHEDWNKMSPREQGAFCGVCSKTVIDFTALSDEQVKNYFMDNRGQKTCGRFRNEQLTNDADYLPKLLSADIPLWKKFLAALFILFAGLLTGCKNEATVGKMHVLECKQVTTGVTLTDVHPIADTTKPPPPLPAFEFLNTVGELRVEIIMGAPAEIVEDPVEIMGVPELPPDTADAIAMMVVDFCLDEQDLPLPDTISIKVSKQDSLHKQALKKDSVKYYLDPE